MTMISIKRRQAQGSRLYQRRVSIWLLAVIFLFCSGAGVVYAWSIKEVRQINYLQSHQAGLRIDEVCPDNTFAPGSTKTKEISFANIGSTPLFLRIAWSETWENEGKWLEDDGTHCLKNWTDTFDNEWMLIDGWYYYLLVLPAGGITGSILDSITFSSNLPADHIDGEYSLDFIAEAVQLSNEAAVNTQAVQTVFERTATVTIISVKNGAVTEGTVAWGGEV